MFQRCRSNALCIQTKKVIKRRISMEEEKKRSFVFFYAARNVYVYLCVTVCDELFNHKEENDEYKLFACFYFSFFLLL